MNSILDLQQQAAVRTTSRYTMVNAGAGSGKTRVLVERIAWLIQTKGISASEILALTYSRKASQEMQERLKERLGERAVSMLRVGTYHSVALRYARMFGCPGYSMASATVYSDWETRWLLKDVAKEVKAPAGYAKDMEKYWTDGMVPDQFSAAARLFDVFTGRCREFNALTYGDLNLLFYRLIPNILSRPLKHVLVDEAQDLDKIQWTTILELVDKSKCDLTVVGDIDQSIYAFRGAQPLELLRLKDYFDIYPLETNYRSVAAIVESAKKLISHNEERIPKNLNAHRKMAGRFVCLDEVDSAQAVNVVRAAMKLGNSVAVLSRTHALLQKFSRLLNEAGIKHHYVGKRKKSLDGEEFRKVHAFLKLRCNEHDNFSFSFIRDLLGIDDEEYRSIRRKVVISPRSHLRIFVTEHCHVPERVHLKAFFRDIDDPKDKLGLMRLGDAFQDFLTATLEKDFAILKSAPSELSWLMEEYGWNKTLRGYLDFLALYDVQEEVKVNSEGLQVMTIHAAKGLEWDTVVLLGWNEGILPSQQSIDSGDRLEIEEERRLAYVAMTRAREVLMITSRPQVSYGANGKEYRQPTSRFIHELFIQ